MNDCKYCEIEISDGIEHISCQNEDMKQINCTSSKSIPCIGTKCGKYKCKNKECEK